MTDLPTELDVDTEGVALVEPDEPTLKAVPDGDSDEE